jgi:beta-glucosidase
MTISVEVVNTGNVAGKEVVQLYISAPGVSMNKPGLELKGFAKTKLLMPQERQTVTFEIDSRSLASFDASASSWIAEAGSYTVSIGASSEDIKASGAFEVPGEIMVKKQKQGFSTGGRD